MVANNEKTIWRLILLGLLPLTLNDPSFGQTPIPQAPVNERQQMVEQHKEMAAMHTKMVTCLEEGKPIDVCRQEMSDFCANRFEGDCPMGLDQRHGGGRRIGGGGPCRVWH